MSWFFTPRGNNGNSANVNSEGALHVVDTAPSGAYYVVANKTGTIAAALAANGTVFAMRLNPGYSGKAYIEAMKIRFTCIVAYTTPITQTRELVIARGAGAATSGGTAIAAASTKDSEKWNTGGLYTDVSNDVEAVGGGQPREHRVGLVGTRAR